MDKKINKVSNAQFGPTCIGIQICVRHQYVYGMHGITKPNTEAAATEMTTTNPAIRLLQITLATHPIQVAIMTSIAQIHSLQASYLAKVHGPLIGYGSTYELFYFFYKYMWTLIGAKQNKFFDIPMKLLIKGCPLADSYWKTKHAAVVDCQRQCGWPTLFYTIAPYEWNFPYHRWIESKIQQNISIAHVLPIC